MVVTRVMTLVRTNLRRHQPRALGLWFALAGAACGGGATAGHDGAADTDAGVPVSTSDGAALAGQGDASVGTGATGGGVIDMGAAGGVSGRSPDAASASLGDAAISDDGAPTAALCGPFDFKAVSDALAGAVTAGTVPGAGLVIVRPGCAPLFQQAFGDQKVDSVIELASASKLPAASAIMTLVDAGKLALDDKVSKFITDWPADKADITLRELLSHTSGLPGDVACIGDAATTLEACTKLIGAATLASKPGTAFAYGGASFQVAGRVAEIVSGKSWNAFFSDSLTKPCGLDALSFAAGANDKLGSDTNPRIAGGAAANLAAYATFLTMHMADGVCGDKRILSRDAIAEMRRDEVTANVTIASSPLPDTWHYGLGWWREPPVAAAADVTLFSDPGAFGAYPWVDTVHGYGAFLLVRKSLKDGLGIVRAVRPLIDAALAK